MNVNVAQGAVRGAPRSSLYSPSKDLSSGRSRCIVSDSVPVPYTFGTMKIALMFLSAYLFCASANAQAAASAASPDIRTYKTVGAIRLTAHVFRPSQTSTGNRAPAILLFHGGGWVAGSPEWVYEAALRYAQYGAVAIAVEYRLCDQKSMTPLDSRADARDVLRWIRSNAADLGIDPDRIAAYGVSAGGQLAAALATIDDHQHPATPVPAALVMISPAVSVTHDGWFQRLLLDKAPAADLSPDEHINKRLPPTIIFHGISDTLVPIAGVRRYCERAKLQGSDCEIVEYANVGHLFTRKLDSQESDFDPDPNDVADSHLKGDSFLATHGFLPKYPSSAVR
jgi:acetyl esterase